MAGGRYHTRQQFSARAGPQWSPGLMAGGSPPHVRLEGAVGSPQWSPGLMAGGSEWRHPSLGVARPRRNGAPA